MSPRSAIEIVRDFATELAAELPEEIRAQLAAIRIVVLTAPGEALQAEGVEPAEAGAYIVRGEDPMPLDDGMSGDPQDKAIYLFAKNIVPFTRQRVRDVFLHEVAHACGLDEDEVREALGELYPTGGAA